MATKILGKVAITPKGEYNNATTYQNLDLVTYDGGSYLALKETKGNLPTNNKYWQLIAEKGQNGEKGETGEQGEKGQDGTNGTNGKNGTDGYTPVKGKDYYTEADKKEMVNLVLEALPSAEEVSF
jgi:hypothetical protein